MKFFEETSSTSKQIRPSILVLLMAVLVITWLLRMNYWDQPFQMDEGVYSYVGWGMLENLVPYKDVFDHKPPSIYVMYSLAFLLFGPTALSIKIFATIYSMGSVLAVFLVARRLAGSKAGCLAALLFGIFSSGPRIEGGGVNTEIFMVLPYTLAAYSLLRAVETNERKHYLLFGLWTGLASTIKQVAVVNLFWVGAYLLVCMWRAKNRKAVTHALKDAGLVAFGTTLAWLPYCLYFYLKDALHHFYYWQVSFNLDYIAEGHGAAPNFAVFWHQTKYILGENGILWLLALAGIAWKWQELRKSRVFGLESSTGDQQVGTWFIMSTWPLFSFLGVSLGGHFYGHYYIQIIPPLAVLGGVGLIKLSGQVRVRGIEILRSPVSLVLTLLFAKALLLFVITDAPYYLSYNGDQISYHQYRTPLFSVTRFIGKYIREHTKPDELVYVWATNPEINFYALRKTPSPFLVQRSGSRVSVEEVIQSWQKAPPKYIVVIDEMKRFPQLEDYIRQNYQEETDTELEELKQLLAFNVYRRKEG
jgi:4-amino-4-deoxy-L-arabinose transferase-like glycosyltransferase